jgi:hypothetical protein
VSPREKKLLIFFALGGFAILNLLGYKFYATQKQKIDAAHMRAVGELKTAEMTSANRDSVAAVMEWVNTHQPRPSDYQTVQSALVSLVETEAKTAGLTFKNQRPLGRDTEHANYHRVKTQISLTGTEKDLYNWLCRISEPEKFRAITFLRLSPNKEDDSKIDCTAIAEQWFVPASES